MNKKSNKVIDKIKIRGYVTIYQEDEKGNREYKVINARNKWVDAGLKGLTSALLCNSIYVPRDTIRTCSWWANGFQMYVGGDTETPTTHGMVELVAPIGAAPGTPPDATWGEGITNPSTGVYRVKYLARWNAGVLSGVCGELALYLRAFTSLEPGWSASASGSLVMVSRLASADGEFSSFTIDPNKSLTVEWIIEVSFA